MIRRLIGLRLRATFAAMNTKKKDGTYRKPSAGKIILLALLYLYVAATFLFISTIVAVGLAMSMIPSGQSAMYFGLATVFAFGLVLVFSIFETKSELFECKDTELLLSMPIKPSDIVIARLMTVLIYNFIEAGIVIIPFSVVYAVLGGNPLYSVLGVISVFAVTLLATSVAMAFGYLVAMISRKLKNNSILTSFISVILFVVFFVVYYSLLSYMPEGDELIITVPDQPFITAIGAASSGNILALALLLFVSFGVSYLAYRIVSAKYIGIVTYTGSEKRKEYKRSVLKKGSALEALTRKELRLFFSSSTYILNSALGNVFTLIFGVYVLIFGKDLVATINTEISFPYGFIESLTLVGIAFMCSMSNISASALSLEGKSFWIIKTLPVPTRTVLISKILPHIIVSLPFNIVAAILCMIGLGVDAFYAASYIVLPIAMTVLYSILGLIFNVAFPKLEFENEAQPIKQSLAVFLSGVVEVVYSFIIAAIVAVPAFFGFGIVGILIATLLTLCAAIGFWFVLVGPSARRLESL